MMMYRYLYYNLFRLWLKKKDEKGNAHINAVITITFLFYANIMSIPLLLFAANRYVIFDLPDVNVNVRGWIVGVLLVLGMLNYYLLARKRQHTKIVEEFGTENAEKRKKGLIITIVYLLVSLGVPLFLLLLAAYVK